VCLHKILREEYLDIEGKKCQQKKTEQYNNFLDSESQNDAKIIE